MLSSQQEKDEWDLGSFYTVVSCHGEDSSAHTVFCGRKPLKENRGKYKKREIPEGWYAEFHYRGDMFAISEAFVDDLYRWMIVKEAKPLANGIGMINCYSSGYPEVPDVRILIPVKRE